MKILIIGERFSSNLGDPIICESVEYLIKKQKPEAEIDFLDLSGRREYRPHINNKNLVKLGRKSSVKKRLSIKLTQAGIDTESLKFKRSQKKNYQYFKNFLENKTYDLAVFAGGQLFKDTFIYPINSIVNQLQENDTPVIFNACGYGEIVSPKMRSLLGEILRKDNVVSISSRDDIDSINDIIGNEKNAVFKTYDPGIWSSEVYEISKKSSNVVGLGIMYAHNISQRKMEEFWIKIISELNREKIKWKFFCNGPQKDYEFAKYILRKLNYKEDQLNSFIVKNPEKPEELVEIIAGFKGIISFRLHSHIVAYSLGIPGVAITWDKKVQYFYNSINFSDRYFDVESDINIILANFKKAIERPYDDELKEIQKDFCQEMLIRDVNQTKIGSL